MNRIRWSDEHPQGDVKEVLCNIVKRGEQIHCMAPALNFRQHVEISFSTCSLTGSWRSCSYLLYQPRDASADHPPSDSFNRSCPFGTHVALKADVLPSFSSLSVSPHSSLKISELYLLQQMSNGIQEYTRSTQRVPNAEGLL
jgi:hypothetical protein